MSRVKLTPEQWLQVRTERELGIGFRELAERFGVSQGAIRTRASKENWGADGDVADIVRRMAVQKMVGVGAYDDSRRKASLMNDAADRLSTILRKHQTDWEEHRETFPLDRLAEDYALTKNAKMAAEVIRLRQMGERLAHGAEDSSTKAEVVIERSYGGKGKCV